MRVGEEAVDGSGVAGASEVRHELGNASLLLDVAMQLLQNPDAASFETAMELLHDVKRRIDQIEA